MSNLKGKGKAKAEAEAEETSNSYPRQQDEQAQPNRSVLSGIGASAVGLAKDVLGASGSGLSGEEARNDVAVLMGGKGGAGGSQGLGRNHDVGGFALREGVGGIRASGGLRGVGDGVGGQGGGGSESVREYVKRSEEEFSSFLDGVPSLGDGHGGEYAENSQPVSSNTIGNRDLIQGSGQLHDPTSTPPGWENIWTQSAPLPAAAISTSTSRPENQSDGNLNTQSNPGILTPGAHQNHGAISDSFADIHPASPVSHPASRSAPTDLHVQESRDGEEAIAILDTRLEDGELVEGDGGVYDWEGTWGLDLEQRRRIAGIVGGLLGLGGNGDEMGGEGRGRIGERDELRFLPDYEREREEVWRWGREGGGQEEEEEEYMSAGVSFRIPRDRRRMGGGQAQGNEMEKWKSDWEGVLNGYTDEVWGGLLPLVKEAREELEGKEEGNEEEEGKRKSERGELMALKRLELVLGHLRS
ncbi:hypothetical protein DSL72_002465 [Monilinia vaccinii-corymbosi]|uniref:Uncharacterized protein n=1 Tax=Monilinia vaccinii-corymbosi TaxID=61207 RepID=A0A8A3PCQ1_9HELO|nr:hypothetical protein DSL72_002465 [Monilinia vaccinii-corymbosi]